jgi:hypothetical protein
MEVVNDSFQRPKERKSDISSDFYEEEKEKKDLTVQ